MSISFGEILIVFLVGILFFKPAEIKAFINSFLSTKRTLEKEVNGMVENILDEPLDDSKHTIEFFDVERKCQKQQY